jgi:tRNA(fMet)-specific endonuclease VapC
VIVLDTDHLNYLQIGKGKEFTALLSRLNASTDRNFATTIVTFEEHARGWLAGIQRTRDVTQQVRPYDQLLNLVHFYQAWKILRFDEKSAARFMGLRAQRVRIGTLDLKIASIVLENGGTLLSANSRDFDQVPGLQVEDWLH